MKLSKLALIVLLSFNLFIPKLEAKNSGLAVLLIDMQYQFYKRGGVENTQGLKNLVAKQQMLLSWATKEGIPVIVYEYNGFGQTDDRLVSVLTGSNYRVISKGTDGAFDDESSARESLNYLKNWNVDTVIVAGINGNACVVSTVDGAIRNNFEVIISSDLIGDLNINPPKYPNDSWYDYIIGDKSKYVFFRNLEEIIN